MSVGTQTGKRPSGAATLADLQCREARVTGPTDTDTDMTTLTRLIPALAIAGVAAFAAGGANAAGRVLFEEKGVVVTDAGRDTTISSPSSPGPRPITGATLGLVQGFGNSADPALGFAILHDDGGTACPGGVYLSVNLKTAVAKDLDIGTCSEDAEVSLGGTAEKPLAVVTRNGKAVKRIPLR